MFTADIDDQIGELQAVDVAAMSVEEQARFCAEVDRLRTRIDATQLVALRTLDTSGGTRADGANGVSGWLRSQTGTTSLDAGRRQTLTTWLAHMPATEEAFLAGRITAEHVRLMSRCLANARTRDHFDAEQEQELLASAEAILADKFADRVTHWIARRDVDGSEPDDPSTDRTYVNQVGDRIKIDADLSLETGLPIMEAIEEQTDKIFHADKRHAEENICSDRDVRPRSNQRSQALAELIGLGAAAPSNTTRREPAFVVVADHDEEGHPTFTSTNGTVIPIRLATKWAMRANFVHLLHADVIAGARYVDLDGNVIGELDLGRTRRLVNRAQRRALAARDRGCAFPGCDKPPAWADAHHILEWEHGGETNMNNLVLLCRFHHVLIHLGLFNVAIEDDQPVFTTAEGGPVRNRRLDPPPAPTPRVDVA